MAIKCIALDLDGTTLLDDKRLSGRTRKAMEAAISKGVRIVAASGRCFDALPAEIRQMPGIEYAITSNGAAVYDLRQSKCLIRYSIAQDAVEKIIEMTKAMPCAYEAFWDGKAYAQADYIKNPCKFGVSAELTAYIQATRNSVADIVSFMTAHKHELDSVDVVAENELDCKVLLEKLSRANQEIYFTPSLKNRIEIASCHAGKHKGLQYVLKRCNISRSETAAFGDADNDVEMIRFVRYGIAVQNASKNCLDAAWRVVPSNMADGVAIGIENLLSLK